LQLIDFFLYFVIYSFIGWIFESVYCSVRDKKVTNRGFLTGPFIPIYGFAGIIFVIVFYGRDYTLIGLFATSMLIASALEYITSYLMEKIFNARWWSYADDPFNLNGRICLGASVAFGFLSVIAVEIIHPYTERFVSSLEEYTRVFVAGAFFALFIIDIFGTVSQLVELNRRLKELETAFSKYVESAGIRITDIRAGVIEKFEESDFFSDNLKKVVSKPKFQIRRLKRAFPRLKYMKYNEFWERIKKRIK